MCVTHNMWKLLDIEFQLLLLDLNTEPLRGMMRNEPQDMGKIAVKQRANGDLCCTPMRMLNIKIRLRSVEDFNSINLIPVFPPAKEKENGRPKVQQKGKVQKEGRTSRHDGILRNTFRPTFEGVWNKLEVLCSTISTMSMTMNYRNSGTMTMMINGMWDGDNDLLCHKVRNLRGVSARIWALDARTEASWVNCNSTSACTASSVAFP